MTIICVSEPTRAVEGPVIATSCTAVTALPLTVTGTVTVTPSRTAVTLVVLVPVAESASRPNSRPVPLTLA
ncbi:MAG: hypothetical protein BWY37_01163 [Firmicutes bacterium ADurb.Bin262]|nr:MAG: hypothetical protein BWY37_01163 [Firmicutes bacterium ADurb.Bin262]